MPNVFISYRRIPSAMLADLIYTKLQEHGIDAYVDARQMDGAGPFPKRLLRAIEMSDVFVCLVADTTFDSKWVRQEVEHANNLGKPLIPVFQESYTPLSDYPTESIGNLLGYDGIHVFDKRNVLIDESIGKLAQMVRKTTGTSERETPQQSRRRWLIPALAALIVIAALIAVFASRQPTPLSPAEIANQRLTQTAALQIAGIGTQAAEGTINAIMTEFVTETRVANLTLTPPTATTTLTSSPSPTRTPLLTATPNLEATLHNQLTLDVQATNSVPTDTPPPTPTDTSTPSPTATPTLTATLNLPATQTAEAVGLATARAQAALDAQATVSVQGTQTRVVIDAHTDTSTALPIFSRTPTSTPTVTSTATSTATSTQLSTFTPMPLIATPLELAKTPTQAQKIMAGLEPISPANGRQVKQLAQFEHDRIREIAWSPKGRILAIIDSVGIWLYDADAINTSPHLLEGSSKVFGVVFSPDGGTLASVGGDGGNLIRLWDVATGKGYAILEGGAPSPDGVPLVKVNILFSPDGATLASVDGDGGNLIRLWDVATGKGYAILEGQVSNILFSPDGATLASVGGDGDDAIRLWDVATGESHIIFTEHAKGVKNVVFSPDGATLASVGVCDKVIKLWDIQTDTLIHILLGVDETESSNVTLVQFSPDGKSLASGSGMGCTSLSTDTSVKLWDVQTGELKYVRSPDNSGYTSVSDVVFSPDSKALAAMISGYVGRPGGYNYTVVGLWDVATGESYGGGYMVRGISFSPDGAILALGSHFTSGTIYLSDVTTGASVVELEGHTGSISEVQFSSDGAVLASSSDDGTIRLWGIPTTTPT